MCQWNEFIYFKNDLINDYTHLSTTMILEKELRLYVVINIQSSVNHIIKLFMS